MKDQVRVMIAWNVTAVYAGDQEADEQTVHDICKGLYQLVYMSPESLLTDMQWRDTVPSPIYQSNLVALVTARLIVLSSGKCEHSYGVMTYHLRAIV